MPKLNLKLSVLSLSALVIGLAREKVIGPSGLYQSNPKPIELLILLLSNENRNQHPKCQLHLQKTKNQRFEILQIILVYLMKS